MLMCICGGVGELTLFGAIAAGLAWLGRKLFRRSK